MSEGREAGTSLAAILAARDARLALQLELGARRGWPLVSLTLVSPGPVKDDARRRSFMDLAEARLAEALLASAFPVLERLRKDGPAGPEALWAVSAPPLGLKALAADLEDRLPGGRLLDADVLVAPAPGAGPSRPAFPEPLSRSLLGLPPRACLLCGRDARHCMAGRAHSAAELAEAVQGLLDRGLEGHSHEAPGRG